jgi:1,4-alpha-glucan branching enzyme
MTPPQSSTLEESQVIEAIAGARAADPFAVLGPHQREVDGRRVLVIRTSNPGARHVDVLPDEGNPIPMVRRHDAGVFEATIDRDTLPARYTLRVVHHDGRVEEQEDPYRFDRSITDYELYLFGEGRFVRAFDKLGSHIVTVEGVQGVHFAVWAPTAERVSVVGDFNRWDGRAHPMRALVPSGLWEIFIPGLGQGERYKYEIRARGGALVYKADPYAYRYEVPPRSASIVWDHGGYEWRDREWIESRPGRNSWFDRPMSIYEVHLGSWARPVDQPERWLTYREIADRLIPYVKDIGYTHIELLPVMEHPFYGSWGYQVTGFFAPSSRFGAPEDLKYLIDECHVNEIGVILDWVPAHFPKDAHGLARFDGTAAYEHQDPRQGEHQDWGTLIFNYGRNEVRNFLLSNALFWLDQYHADGLRVDAVASMLYLDYSRRDDEWVPNKFGGRENLDAIEFLRQFNTLTHAEHPGTLTIAEESTSWPGVSKPVYLGGLGFTYKWNMGWMHDILKYVSQDPVFRRYAHNHLTFSMLYNYSENFVLPFSHDEVVHMKGSLIDKIPGDAWQKAATLRALYGYMYGHPGKKLLFMGSEVGQWREWNHDYSLDWHLLEQPLHRGVQRWVRDLNEVYGRERSLTDMDFDPSGFLWIDCSDNENSVVSFMRRARDPRDFTIMIVNFTPVVREGYVVGVPEPGLYVEVLNSDGDIYGGSNVGNGGALHSQPSSAHGHAQSLRLTLPPLGFLLFKWQKPVE